MVLEPCLVSLVDAFAGQAYLTFEPFDTATATPLRFKGIHLHIRCLCPSACLSDQPSDCSAIVLFGIRSAPPLVLCIRWVAERSPALHTLQPFPSSTSSPLNLSLFTFEFWGSVSYQSHLPASSHHSPLPSLIPEARCSKIRPLNIDAAGYLGTRPAAEDNALKGFTTST